MYIFFLYKYTNIYMYTIYMSGCTVIKFYFVWNHFTLTVQINGDLHTKKFFPEFCEIMPSFYCI